MPTPPSPTTMTRSPGGRASGVEHGAAAGEHRAAQQRGDLGGDVGVRPARRRCGSTTACVANAETPRWWWTGSAPPRGSARCRRMPAADAASPRCWRPFPARTAAARRCGIPRTCRSGGGTSSRPGRRPRHPSRPHRVPRRCRPASWPSSMGDRAHPVAVDHATGRSGRRRRLDAHEQLVPRRVIQFQVADRQRPGIGVLCRLPDLLENSTTNLQAPHPIRCSCRPASAAVLLHCLLDARSAPLVSLTMVTATKEITQSTMM